MSRFLTRIALTVWLYALAQSAAAGVVYNWVNLEGGPVVGRIEIKDEVWKEGGTSGDINMIGDDGDEDDDVIIYPASEIGLLAFRIEADFGGTLELIFGPCAEVHSALSCEESGVQPDEPVVQQPLLLQYELSFGSDFLSGRFFGTQTREDLMSFGGDVLWLGEWHDLHGHDEGPCPEHDPCTARGVFYIDRSTIPVPEPSSWLALVAALSALVATRRGTRLAME